MAPLDTGRYIITNSKFRNVVHLADANSCSDLRGDWQQNRPGEMWNVVLLSNGNYTIKNFDYSSHACCEFIAKPDVGNSIVGGDRQQQWKIIEDDGNSYVICPTRNGQVYWHLADEESGTPITLENYCRTNKIRWEFSQVDAEGSGAVDGDETRRVCGNDDAPSLPVLLPTLVQVTTPVRVPTPPVLVPTPPVRVRGPSFPVVELSPVQALSPGKYYAIGIARTNQYLARSWDTVYVEIPRLGPQRWLFTKHGDNWQIEQSGKYLWIRKNSEGRVSDHPTQLSLTPGGRPNEFSITDMDSGQYFDGLEFTDRS